ncbi:MAG: hypothetical protein AAF821_21185 [Cyanobacteria bacterium P01_D01_bin.156]
MHSPKTYSDREYINNLPRQPYSQQLGQKSLIFASLTMILASLLLDLNGFPKNLLASSDTPETTCDQVVNNTAKLSRKQLAQLLTIPERDTKDRVQQIISDPYCQLPTLNVRSGVAAEREAYPLAFDPGTTLVILYENNEYAGYRFNFE